MNLFRRSIELVVIRDIFNPQNNIETYTGYDVELLLKQAFGGNGLSENVRLYHGNLLDEVTPKTPQDVDKVMRLNGRIYAVVKPMGIGAYIAAVVVSTLVSVAMAFLMPQPVMPNQGNQPPSPNNALAARTNKQRLGGRIPDIYGTVWSAPDLIAPTYSVYIDSKKVEMSYMCVGRGRYHVEKALDDTTPIQYVSGSSVYVYDPDYSLNDTPDFLFGSAMTPDEAALSRLAVKRYTSVNGQLLAAADGYTTDDFRFLAPNIVKIMSSTDLSLDYKTGDTFTIEGASDLASFNELTDIDDNPITYMLNGSYTVLSASGDELILDNPSSINTDWTELANNADSTKAKEVTISTNTNPFWRGWYYSDATDHESFLLNVIAPSGLWFTDVATGKWYGLKLFYLIESEVVDVNGQPVSGTTHTQEMSIASSEYDKYGNRTIDVKSGYKTEINTKLTTSDTFRQKIAQTVSIDNPHFAVGKRIRFRIRRNSLQRINRKESIAQDLRIEDFYGARLMTPADAPKGVTTVYSKTLATEGALSLKERKLRLLVQRYVTDATTGILKLSNRADDIIRHIATDPKIGNLQLSQIDVAQMKAEIDAQVTYFGTDKCSEFCGTFDDNNLSAEETMQIVSKAVFSQAKRQGNKIMLDFERVVPASVAVFNSHNILPDTFTASESLGIANDYDGVTVEYTDPTDDATITLSYPSDSLINPHEDKLIGVRNEVQAHMHMMRMYNKDRHAYKSCEFVAGDESNIVVRTNRITVADQLRANIQQGSVDSIETVGSDIVLYTTDPVSIEPTVLHTLFIQTINNGVEAIEVTARDDYSVKLARLPSGEISTGYDKVVQATYQIVTEEDKDRDAYLVGQKDPSEAMTNKLTCTNYDDRYYQNDSDFTNGLIA